mgnify:CR=1 FL=1
MFEHLDLNHLLATYGYWAIFIGCLLEGETILILGGGEAWHDHLAVLSEPFTAEELAHTVGAMIGPARLPTPVGSPAAPSA